MKRCCCPPRIPIAQHESKPPDDIFHRGMTAMYEEAERFHEETDRDLERRVTAFLADRNLPALRRLGVRSHRGVVTLRGRVRTFYEKQLAVSPPAAWRGWST